MNAWWFNFEIDSLEDLWQSMSLNPFRPGLQLNDCVHQISFLLHVGQEPLKSCFELKFYLGRGVWRQSKLDEKYPHQTAVVFWWKGMKNGFLIKRDKGIFINYEKVINIHPAPAAWKTVPREAWRMKSKRTVCVGGKSTLKSNREIVNQSIMKRRIN